MTASSQSEQFIIRQSTQPIAPKDASAQAPIVDPQTGPQEVEHWSNLTLRRISEQDAGLYKCVAQDQGGQAEANVSLLVINLIEKDTGKSPILWVVIAIVVLLTALSSLTICLCQRAKKRKQNREGLNGANLNESANQLNGSDQATDQKSVFDTEMDAHGSTVIQQHDHPASVSQDSDTMDTTSNSILLLPVAGPQPGFVTLPRRPRMPNWESTSSPMTSSPSPFSFVEERGEPLYGTMGRKIRADGSSMFPLSLNKTASLGRPPRAVGTLNRGQKISSTAHYVPMERLDIPPASYLGQHRGLQQSTPNILSSGHYNNMRLPSRAEPVLGYLNHNINTSTRNRGIDDREAPFFAHDTSHVSNSTSFLNGDTLPPIVPDCWEPGSRANIATLLSQTGTNRRKTPVTAAPKPGVMLTKPASVVPFDEMPSTPVKIAPRPPLKPEKQLSATDSNREVAYEDEGIMVTAV